MRTVPCEMCLRQTPMVGTRRCNECWNLEKLLCVAPRRALRMLYKIVFEQDQAPLPSTLGWINLYRYDTGRLHAGTGVYATEKAAKLVTKHKTKRLVATVPVALDIKDISISPDGSSYKFPESAIRAVSTTGNNISLGIPGDPSC